MVGEINKYQLMETADTSSCVACFVLRETEGERRMKISELEILVQNVTNSFLISYLHIDLTL